jgi:hypothetical protein
MLRLLARSEYALNDVCRFAWAGSTRGSSLGKGADALPRFPLTCWLRGRTARPAQDDAAIAAMLKDIAFEVVCRQQRA